MTGQELVDQVKLQGFDATDLEILAWLNLRYRKAVARARSYRKTLTSAGPTVAGQAAYTLPVDIVEILEVRVAGTPYKRGRHEDQRKYELGYLELGGVGGLYMEDASSAGVQQIALLPKPTASGEELAIYAATQPPALTLGTAPVSDLDFDDALIEGGIATGLARTNERRDEAAFHEERYTAGVEEYRQRCARRFRGSGPAQIRVVGLNA